MATDTKSISLVKASEGGCEATGRRSCGGATSAAGWTPGDAIDAPVFSTRYAWPFSHVNRCDSGVPRPAEDCAVA